MTLTREIYNLTRNATLTVFNDYIEKITSGETINSDLVTARVAILNLEYNELLILQSSIERWDMLMNDPDLNFRRELCLKLYNLKRSHLMEELGLSDGAVSNLFNKSSLPKWPRPFQLSILMNHPWQLVNKIDPDKYSYSESPEYFHEGVSKRIYLNDLSDERSNITSIRGYVILDPQGLFQQESAPVTGRWVTTYEEFDYFEFHLNYEPLINKVLREGILRVFPLAKYIITTFRPCTPSHKRSLWVIIPKDESMGSYLGILHELKDYRDNTEFHKLN